MKKKILILSLSLMMISFNSFTSKADIINDQESDSNELEFSESNEEDRNSSDLEISSDENSDKSTDKLEINDENKIEDKSGEVSKLEISGLREDLTRAQKAVQDITPYNDDEKEMLDKYNQAVAELNDQIDKIEQNQSRPEGAVGGSQILDVQTIPTRIQLLIRIGRAIRFGTTELSNKVVAAHTKLAEYVTTGILYTLNPFASSSQIMDYINQWDALEQELLQYPDLQPQDIATIYKKASVSRQLADARRVMNENRRFKGFSIKYLEEPIRQTSAMLWRITVTCGELDEQVEKLNKAVEKITGPKVRASNIEFMEGDKGYIQIDKKTKIRPVIRPEEVKNKDYILYSSNSYIARVSGDEIIPLKTGNVNIIAVSKDSGVKKAFNLQIVGPGEVLENLPQLDPSGDNNIDLSEFYK